jgi:serine protein kinase
MSALFETLRSSVKRRFHEEKRILSFEEFVELCESNPHKYLRKVGDWISDAFAYYDKKHGKEETLSDKGLFQVHYQDRFQPVFGQEEVQQKLRQVLEGFAKTGRSDKVVVLHGPNGSAKTTLCRNLFAALEAYSHTPEGALYTFSWVFPLQKSAKSMGIAASSKETQLDSYAHCPSGELGTVLRSELHENPLYLIPKEERREILARWKKESKLKEVDYEYLRSRFENSDLSHKNMLLFETLINEYHGDLLEVFKHIRVERFYLSYQLRNGLAVIEPQFGIDAQVRQVTMDASLAHLPPALQSLNLYQLDGELVAGNRGVVEFSDLLKRPVESFKYLLSASENSRIQVGPYSADLDALLLATTNDHQLEAFREHPEFMSFRGRFEFIRVPYLLSYTDEAKIYERELNQFREVKEVLPHTSEVLALWAVMSRMKKPLTKNKSNLLHKILETLSPLEKARAYNSDIIPERFTEEERREFKLHLPDLKKEHQTQAFYEGLIGPSARELRILLQNAALKSENQCLGPLAVIRELKAHIQKHSDYEYLRIEAVTGYHDYALLVDLTNQEWLRWVDRELRGVLGMGQLPELRKILENYIQKVMKLIRGEKIKNRITGKSEEPHMADIEGTEKMFGIQGSVDEFRQSILGRLGAWSLENKKNSSAVSIQTLGEGASSALPFDEIFPDLVQKIRQSLKAEEDQKLSKMADVFATQDVQALSGRRDPDDQALNMGEKLAIRAFRGLQKEMGYGPRGALEAIGELMRVNFRNLQDSKEKK